MYKNKVLIVFIVSLFFLVCKIDHGLAPLPGKLIVEVSFRGTPPEDTEGIYLIVAPQFPPHAINELYHSPNSLPINKKEVITELALPYGHYDALSLWWYSTETKANLADVLALPLDPYNNLRPLGFDLSPQNPVYHMKLSANWLRVDRDSAIEGTIYFNGPFPANTLATAVAAYVVEPTEPIHYLTFLKSIDFSINKNPYHYRLPLRHGSVKYLAVFWLPEKANLTDFEVIGVYMDPNNPQQYGKLSLKPNQTLTGIDIYADWSKIQGGTP